MTIIDLAVFFLLLGLIFFWLDKREQEKNAREWRDLLDEMNLQLKKETTKMQERSKDNEKIVQDLIETLKKPTL